MTWRTFVILPVIYNMKSEGQSQENPEGNCLTQAAEQREPGRRGNREEENRKRKELESSPAGSGA